MSYKNTFRRYCLLLLFGCIQLSLSKKTLFLKHKEILLSTVKPTLELKSTSETSMNLPIIACKPEPVPTEKNQILPPAVINTLVSSSVMNATNHHHFLPNQHFNKKIALNSIGSVVSNGCNHQGYNILWKTETPITEETQYFEFSVTNQTGNIFFGLTTDTEFHSSCDPKCLCYGETSLYDGRQSLTQHLGPKATSGDLIGILTSYKEHRLHVAFTINKKLIGMEYNVVAKTISNMYPFIKVMKQGIVTITKNITVIDTSMLSNYEYMGIKGYWRVYSFVTTNEQPILSPIPVAYTPMISLFIEGETLELTLTSYKETRYIYTKHQRSWMLSKKLKSVVLHPTLDVTHEMTVYLHNISRLLQTQHILKMRKGQLFIASDEFRLSCSPLNNAPTTYYENILK